MSYTWEGRVTPPLPDPAHSVPGEAKADPTFAWTLGFVPLLVAAFPYVVRGASELVGFVVALVLSVGLALADRARLGKAGIHVNVAWAIFLVPGYLIVRTIRAGSAWVIPVVWFVTFFVSLAIPTPAHTVSVTMDPHAVEHQLAQAVRNQAGPRSRITCPEDLDVPVGGSFPCDVWSSYGWTGHIYVTVTDSDGRYQWQLTQ